MIRKTLIALAAVATVAGFATSQAQAKVNIHIGVPGIYIGGGHPGYYDDYYFDDSCGWQTVKVVKWKKGHKIVKFKKKWVCY